MKKNILIISRLLTSGGAERVAANLASEFCLRGEKVWLLVFDGTNATYECKAPVIDLKMPMQKTVLKKAFWYFKIWRTVIKIKKELAITHTISFLNEPDLINILTPVSGKNIVSVRNNRSALNKNCISKIKDRFVFSRADLVVALSQGVRDDLVTFYQVPERKIKVIYNACNTENIICKGKDLKDEFFAGLLTGHDVITAGRLSEQKGQWHLIRAFGEVVKEIPDAKLFILGQGVLKEYLEKLIRLLNLQDSVKLLGYKSNPYSYLTKCTVFVFPSLYEGFGNVLLEAMACGLPIISADCFSGPRELLAPGTSYNGAEKRRIIEAEYGLLTPVCDKKYYLGEALTPEEKMLADAIVKLLLDTDMRERYIGQSGKRIMDFTNDKIMKLWSECLD